jgi:hypothetical protein
MSNPYHADDPRYHAWEYIASVQAVPEVCNEDLEIIIDACFSAPRIAAHRQAQIDGLVDEKFAKEVKEEATEILSEAGIRIFNLDRERNYKR